MADPAEAQEDAPDLDSLMNVGDDDPGSGPTPEADPPADPEAPVSDDGPTPSDDDEPKEWQSLEKKFDSIEDENERKRAIGKQYWEKTRYASETRKENEALKEQLEEARSRRVAEARREEEPKGDPLPPHPDLERLDSRINALSEKDSGLYDEQQKTLIGVSETEQGIAAVKAKIEDADEYQRAVLEQRLEGLEHRKGNLIDRFSDLRDRREDLEYKLDELGQQRQWTSGLLDEQGKDAERERQSRESFNEEFPERVARTIDEVADALGLDPEDEPLRDDLKATVKDRLTVKFWKLGQSEQVDDVDVDELIGSEVKRYAKARDLAGRAKFGKTSREKLSVSGKRPAEAKPTGKGGKRPSGYDAAPKDITALGTVSQDPAMLRGRSALAKRGL